MKISTAEIKKLITECVNAQADEVYSVNDFRQYISRKSNKEFSTGQISGAVRQLSEGGVIKKIERGLYQKGENGPATHNNLNTGERRNRAEFRVQVENSLTRTEQELKQIISAINVWELNANDYEFLGEVKALSEQIRKLRERC